MLLFYILTTLLITGASLGYLWTTNARTMKVARAGLAKFTQQLKVRREIIDKFNLLKEQLVEKQIIQKAGKDVISQGELLKAERGRITITQAELETVESRLRELEEIERELQASSIDTQEEAKIMEKRREEISSKAEELRNKISVTMPEVDKQLGEMTLGDEEQQLIRNIKSEISTTQEKTDMILAQIQASAQQYAEMKKRYDALDIEYAQLFEKFSAAEEAAKNNKES
jgi:chromosome segregation ATPase